jgi:mRNA degradation ribonuclease J1/J2
VGDVNFAIIRDREKLAEAGFFMAVVNVGKDGRIIGDPTFVSRGFANLDGAPELVQGAEETIARTANMYFRDGDNLPHHIESALERYLYTATGRHPAVYAVVN